MSFISIKNLVHDFIKRDEMGEKIGTQTALDDVSIDVSKGQFIAILGRNGSGKSTLAKHINALLYPTTGKVYVNDYDTSDLNNTFLIRKDAGMVFQNPDNQIIATVVEEDVAFGPENMGIPTEEIIDRVDFALKAVGMDSFREHSPNKLSGGQKQRICIAGAIAMEPACLILDEPTSMLDPKGRVEVLETVKRLNKEKNITVIYVTHHMDEVVDADKIFVMNKGKLVLSGSPREVFAKGDELMEYGLALPNPTEVSHSLNKAGYNLGACLSMDELISALKGLREARKGILAADAGQTGQGDAKTGQEDAKTSLESTNTPGQTLLELKKVNYFYNKNTVYEKQAVKDFDLEIKENEYMAIIGHTGSGKSTLIQLFNALLTPESGQVLYKGKDVNEKDYNRKLLRGEVGLAFQYPDHQLFEQTIIKDVCFGPSNQGLSEEEALERAKWALSLVGIDESLYNDSPFELSGGQKKRVAIAGILAMKPKVLILDEPAAGLDPGYKEQIFDAIDRIYQEEKITVVLISHSMEDVAKHAKRIVVLHDGEKKMDGEATEVFARGAELEAIGLDRPWVGEFVTELNKIGFNIDNSILTVDKCIEMIKAEL